jgi:hypothetical protein
MSLGKPPSLGAQEDPDLPSTPITYHDAMRRLCGRYTNVMHSWAVHAPNLLIALAVVRDTKAYFACISELHEKSGAAVTPTQVCQRAAFRMHAAYAVSYICRPALTCKDVASSPTTRTSRSVLMEICCQGLVEALEGYVQLLGMTPLASRSWAMVHNGLGSSLVLGMLGEYERDGRARALAQELLARKDEMIQEYTSPAQQWHTRAMEKLAGLVERHSPHDHAVNNDSENDQWDPSLFWDVDAFFGGDTTTFPLPRAE